MSKQPYRVIIPTLHRNAHELYFDVCGTEENPLISLTIYQSGQNFHFGNAAARSQYVKAYADKKSVGGNACAEADALVAAYWDADADAHVAKYITAEKITELDFTIQRKTRELDATNRVIAQAARLTLLLPAQENELAELHAQRDAL